MKKIMLILAICSSSVLAKDYAKIYQSYCYKCHGKDGSKIVRRFHVNYKPLNKLTKEEIIDKLNKYLHNEVVYSEKTSRLMKKNLQKKDITTQEDIKGMADYIVNHLR